MGRMALSNYLAQSVICTLIFYGYGLGHYQQLPRAWHIPFALALVAVQAVSSVATAQGLKSDRGWIFAYAAPVFGGLVALVLLWWSQRPRRVGAVP